MGDPSSKTDNDGRPKVQCKICERWYHRVDTHVERKHDLSPKDYQKQFPGAEVLSRFAKEKLGELDEEEEIEDEEVDSSVMRFGAASLHVTDDDDLTDYDRRFIPTHDEDWVLGVAEEAHLEALALGIEDNDNILISGPPGVGKTTLAKELAALVNYPLRRIPFHGEMRVASAPLFGRERIVIDPKTGQAITKTETGTFVDAYKRGHWALLDEFDSGPAHVLFSLHAPLETHDRMLTLNETLVDCDERFRVIATSNTLGYGDETGLYSGTAPQNEAFLDRFGVVIRMDYPKKDDEKKIIVDKTGVTDKMAEKMVELATAVREAQKNESTMVSISPRRLIMWAKKAARMGDARRAATITILNKVPTDDRKFLEGVVQRYFGGS